MRLHEEHTRPDRPGGLSRHVFWPVVLIVRWDTYAGLKIGPIILDNLVLIAMAAIFSLFM